MRIGKKKIGRIRDQRAKGFVVAMDLSQIPGVLERQQSALLSNVISAQKHGRKQCESACGGKAMGHVRSLDFRLREVNLKVPKSGRRRLPKEPIE